MLKVIMVGPARNVKGGISSVVNNYYSLGIDKKIDLKYIATMKDGNKFKKLIVAAKAYIEFCWCLKHYDIVHIHMASNASFIRKSFFIKKAKKKNKKIIIHQHSGFFDDYFLRQCNERERKNIIKIFNMADYVIVLSKEWKAFFEKNICSSKKIIIIQNGVICSNKYAKDYSDQNVLFLGKINEDKGIADLIKVIPDILKIFPDTKFYIGGDGEIKKYKKIIERENMNTNVEFLGWVDDEKKKEYFEECSIFILPSYHEGMPMALLEAMSFGLASISTNVGGIPSIINNNNNGYLVTPGDLKEMKKVLISLLANSKLKQLVGLEGKKTVYKQFNENYNLTYLFELYNKLL